LRLSVRAPVAWLGAGRIVHNAQIDCEAGSITYSGPATPVTEADRLIEVDGFLMPAVADRHVHIELSSPSNVLRGGVTAVRDLAWPPERIFPLADASELPTFDGPLIRAAGAMLTAPGGYPTQDRWAPGGTGREVRGMDDARAAVGEMADAGSAAIKVSLNVEAGPAISDAELAVISEEAHSRSLPVTAHAQGPGQVERALGAAIDELAHTPWTARLSDDVLSACARSLRFVSTLDILSYGRDTPEIRTALDNLRRFHASGGRVIYGTDLGNGPIPAGIHTREALLIYDAGLSREEVLASMIRAPLELDAPADMIALGMDPLEDLTAFDDVRLVVRAGRVVTTATRPRTDQPL
jgi:imidazolonepropionase-like amidohydrolase